MARAIGSTLRPGQFISYNAGRSFITALEAVDAQLKALIASGQAAQASEYYELFIAACEEKADELDDSGSNFHDFVAWLFCGWVQAREAAGCDGHETATRLLAWMEDDSCGFCANLGRRLVTVYSPPGLTAFVAAVQARRAQMMGTPAQTTSDGTSFADGAQQLTDVLRSLAVFQGDSPAYLQLCPAERCTPTDCETVAGMYLTQGNAAEALVWVDRGLAHVPVGTVYHRVWTQLPAVRRDVLHALGRTDEAIASAWDEFVAHPSTWTYQTLMRYVPEADRARWHVHAMEATQQAELGLLLQLWSDTQEIDRLVTRLRETDELVLAALSWSSLTSAAQTLATAHPESAARLYRTVGLQMLAHKKSKLYDTALEHFRHAEECYERAGQTAVWRAVVDCVRQQHGKKYGFIPAFERLVQGEPDPPPPTLNVRHAAPQRSVGEQGWASTGTVETEGWELGSRAPGAPLWSRPVVCARVLTPSVVLMRVRHLT